MLRKLIADNIDNFVGMKLEDLEMKNLENVVGMSLEYLEMENLGNIVGISSEWNLEAMSVEGLQA